jgi:hypothetical protein
MVVAPFTATAAVVVGGYLLLRGVVRLFRRKVVITSSPPTFVERSELPAQPLITSKDIRLRRALAAVERAVTFAKKVTASVQKATVALSRELTDGAKSVCHRVCAVYVLSKTFWGDIVRALFSPAAARAILARQHTRVSVVSTEVLGLLKPFLKSRPRNRDSIVIPAIAA